MILSKTCSYAIRAFIYVANNGDGRAFVPIQEVSRSLGISFHFLTRILRTLSARGLLVSSKGAQGGVALGRPAGDIRVIDIVRAIEGEDFFDRCILGLDECSDIDPCPLHAEWVRYREKLQAFFQATTMAELSEGVRKYDFRLKNLEQELKGKPIEGERSDGHRH